MQNYYQKEIETASPEQIRAWQDERLVKTVHHVWDNVEFYRKRMEKAGVTPDDIQGVKDLHKLPFITKDDLRACYPYGLLAADLNDCVRIHSTYGTTGKRVVAFYTQNDIDLWEDCCARAIVAAGGTEEDVVQVCYGYGLFTGGAGLDAQPYAVGKGAQLKPRIRVQLAGDGFAAAGQKIQLAVKEMDGTEGAHTGLPVINGGQIVDADLFEKIENFLHLKNSFRVSWILGICKTHKAAKKRHF